MIGSLPLNKRDFMVLIVDSNLYLKYVVSHAVQKG